MNDNNYFEEERGLTRKLLALLTFLSYFKISLNKRVLKYQYK